ncbi:heparinase II/III family protein [Frankia sp. Mgl5]|uniref:heparinase II/III domain-containing protein n=1 Tax=Frankia sp. Mgl5 TaxID=2933793 RepID=UPI00200CCB98|nr:heparinase II/III family protein [Frankia sp. Mgl5]
MTGPARTGRYLRTLATLRPAQVRSRLRLHAQRAAFTHAPRIATALLSHDHVSGCWPNDFTPFDGRIARSDTGPTADEIVRGHITLLGATRRLHPAGSGSVDVDWNQIHAPMLWRYHLHYWDWAWALTRSDDGGQIFSGLYHSWRHAVRVGQGVAWAPYVASLRAWTLCGLWHPLVRGTAAEDAVRADLGLHRSFLRGHLETDVGGNHLLKNYKALIGLAVADTDGLDRRRWIGTLLGQLERQVLGDGGHYERAPAYHCQVLADLDDLASLLRAVSVDVPAALSEAIDRMRGWLADVLGPDQAVPLLNDGYPVPQAAVDDLLGSSPSTTVPGSDPTDVAICSLLADSGLAVLRAGPWHLIADVGPPCPDDLPAHAHADTLSFLLWADGRPVLVDTGTSTYEPGPIRDTERSSAAHSTVVVDGSDSTEVWGAFRAGRRARPELIRVTCRNREATLTASHDGYRHLPGRPMHQRTWQLDPAGLILRDRITGAGRHRVEILLQLAPGTDATVAGAPNDLHVVIAPPAGRELVLRPATPPRSRSAGRPEKTNQHGVWELRKRRHAVGWQATVSACTVVYATEASLPVEIDLQIGYRADTDATSPREVPTSRTEGRPQNPGTSNPSPA